jgi:hypothetical protein
VARTSRSFSKSDAGQVAHAWMPHPSSYRTCVLAAIRYVLRQILGTRQALELRPCQVRKDVRHSQRVDATLPRSSWIRSRSVAGRCETVEVLWVDHGRRQVSLYVPGGRTIPIPNGQMA